MGKRSKELGYRWEADLVRWLRSLGWSNAKRYGSVNGTNDLGDIDGIPWVWQAKNVSQLGPARLATFLDAAKRQAEAAGKRYYLVALKRRRKGVSDGYAIMPLWMAEEFMRKTIQEDASCV